MNDRGEPTWIIIDMMKAIPLFLPVRHNKLYKTYVVKVVPGRKNKVVYSI